MYALLPYLRLLWALLDDEHATVDLDGIQKRVSIALTPEAGVGDYVIVHVGYAIGMLDPDEAQATLDLFAELADSLVDYLDFTNPYWRAP